MGQSPYRNWPVVGCHAAELGTSYQHSARAKIRCTQRCEYARGASANNEDVYHLWLSQTMNETYPLSTDITQCCKVVERFDTRKKEVGATSHSGEGRQSSDFFADRTLGDFIFQCTVLVADDRVAFIAEFVKVTVVSPDILRELKLADQTRANHKSGDATLRAIFRCVFR